MNDDHKSVFKKSSMFEEAYHFQKRTQQTINQNSQSYNRHLSSVSVKFTLFEPRFNACTGALFKSTDRPQPWRGATTKSEHQE